MIPVVVYASKSSADEKGSVSSQVEHAEMRVAQEGEREIVATFTEEKVSGYRRSRGPQLDAALATGKALAAEHGAAELWVFHSSRLGRGSGKLGEARAIGEIFYDLRRHGVTLRSVEDDAYITDEMLIGVASVMSHKFVEDLAAHTRRGKRARAQKGRPNGRPPYGYRAGDDADTWVPVPEQVPILHRIWDSFAAGESQLSIARALNREGIPTQRGGRWAQGTISAILRNPVYIGKVRHGDELFDGEHEPLVSVELFEKVQRMLGPSPGRRGRPPKGNYLFRGRMLRCGACGSSMVVRTTTRKDGSVHGTYACMGRRDHGPEFCACPDVSCELVDGAALHAFESWGLDFDATREAFESAIDRKLGEVRALVAQAERERLQKIDALARVEADYLGAQITGDTFERLSERLRGELAALAGQIDRLAAQERDVAAEGAAIDGETAILEYLTEIRAAVVGNVRNADGIAALRAALTQLFECFILTHPDDDPARGRSASADPVRTLRLPDALPETSLPTPLPVEGQSWVLWPSVREERLVGYTDPMRPVLDRIPLAKRADNYLMNSISL